MRRRVAIGVLAATLIVFISGAVALRWSWRELNAPFKGYTGNERVITIEAGRSGADIVRSLHVQGLIEHPRLALLYLRFGLEGDSLKAGEYAFSEPLSSVQVLRHLAAGRVLLHPITIREGLTLEETADALVAAGFGDLDSFLSAMRSPDAIADIDPEATDLEGYLFPETYAFAAGTSEKEIVSALVDHCRRVLKMSVHPRLDPASRRSIRDIVTLASIVEKESQQDQERAVIAGVYTNRLTRGMGLYADPTVVFALKKSGDWDGNLTRQDLAIDSPYNTYRHRGLPPGPIASPGLASLVAAAEPADVPYLYFVSRNDGTHVFAETLAEHNRNVYRWQKLYWRERRSSAQSVEESTDS
jgi:UPF0755 protein